MAGNTVPQDVKKRIKAILILALYKSPDQVDSFADDLGVEPL